MREALEKRAAMLRELADMREKLARVESWAKALTKRKNKEWASREIADLRARMAELERNL